MSSSYLVPFGDGQAELVEKKSRFIGRLYPIDDETQALEILDGLRKQHWDATHNVYAYSVRGGATRFSDDGEPSGTAGRPVLDVFTHEGVVNYLCVVTRYFGGTLLGAGGLVRAYAASAKASLDAAGIAEMRRCVTYSLTVGYPLFERTKIEITSANGVIDDTIYADEVTILLHIPEQDAPAFRLRMVEVSAGTINPLAGGEVYVPMRVR